MWIRYSEKIWLLGLPGKETVPCRFHEWAANSVNGFGSGYIGYQDFIGRYADDGT